MVVRKLYFLLIPGKTPNLLKSRVQMPAAEVPKAVLTMAVAMATPSPAWLMLPCLVPLQAKKPKTSTRPPKADRGTECPGMGTGSPLRSKRPMRGPMRTQPTKAQMAGNFNFKSSKYVRKYFLGGVGWGGVGGS
jgi:hypothetical protein